VSHDFFNIYQTKMKMMFCRVSAGSGVQAEQSWSSH